MKKMIILLTFLPACVFGQRFELSARAGISGNLLSGSARDTYVPMTAEHKYKTGGLNPVAQLSFYYLKRSMKIGVTVRHFSTSGRVSDPASREGFRNARFSSSIVQLLHELSYRFAEGKQFTFDAGIQAGPAWHSFNKESINYGQVNHDGEIAPGFVLGMNFTGRCKISSLLSVEVSVNPLFDLLTTPGTFDLPMNAGRNHSTLCMPLTAGVGFSL
jgi:hypothetical protein